jgi:hypothetical protein
MPTMHQQVKDDKYRSLCRDHDVNRDRPATRGLQSIQVTVQLNCTLAHKGGLQATRNVVQDGIMPPSQPSLVKCVFTMDEDMKQHLLHDVLTELAIDQSVLPPSSEVSEGGQDVCAAKAGFRHVPDVLQHRAPTKRGAPTNEGTRAKADSD